MTKEQELKLREENLISHPLDTVVESCMSAGINFNRLAESLSMDLFELRDFLAERTPIDDDIAKGLEDIFHVDKQFWINRQVNFNKRLYELLNSGKNAQASVATEAK